MSCFDNSAEDRAKARGIPDWSGKDEAACCRCGQIIGEGETGNDTEDGLMCDDCYIEYTDELEAAEEDYAPQGEDEEVK